MKKIFKSLVILAFYCSFLSSQWVVQNTGTSMNINALDFINVNTGFAAGDNSKVYRTTNGGLNWLTLTVPGNPVNFTRAVERDPATGLKPGIFASDELIIGTTNAGANWYQTNLGAHYIIGDLDEQGGNIYAAAYLLNNAEDTIRNASLFRSTNDGVNWVQINTIPMNAQGDPIHGVDIKLGMKFISNDTGYIATVRGVYKTVNAGMNFVFLPNSPPSPQVVVAGSNNISPYYIGVDKPNKLEIYKTTNGGNSWLLLSSIPDPNDSKIFSAISCPVNTDRIYLTISNRATGMNPVQDTSIYYSSNGGANWNYQTLSVTNVKINSIYFVDANTGYIAGSGGTILKTTNGGNLVGIQPVSNEIPEQYKLYQNYPNPFNPVTNIKFDVTSKGSVKLTVFNIQGQEISTLVNQELQTGSYKVNWNASSYPSGIYFYRLEAGDFSDTKKMLLVK